MFALEKDKYVPAIDCVSLLILSDHLWRGPAKHIITTLTV